jgi:hypothetical protein
MCTIAILLEVVAGAPLVLAANRDETYTRPTRPPESLGDRIAGGVDILSGGTWLAIRRDGRFAAVTNQQALVPMPPGLRSRGLAVRELAAAADDDGYIAALDPTLYESMNLVWGDAHGVSIAYARREGLLEIEPLPRGIHVLCNDRLGSKGFPRGTRLHQAIANRARRSYPRGLAALAPAGQGGTRADRHVYSSAAVRHAVVDDHRRSPRPDARVPTCGRTTVHDAVRRSEGALVTEPRARKLVVARLPRRIHRGNRTCRFLRHVRTNARGPHAEPATCWPARPTNRPRTGDHAMELPSFAGGRWPCRLR